MMMANGDKPLQQRYFGGQETPPEKGRTTSNTVVGSGLYGIKVSEDKRHFLEELLVETYCYIDADFNLEDCNANAESLLGQSRDYLIGQSLFSLVNIQLAADGSDKLDPQTLLAEASKSTPVIYDKAWLQSQHIGLLPIKLIFQPIVEDGVFLGGVVVIYDLTDQR